MHLFKLPLLVLCIAVQAKTPIRLVPYHIPTTDMGCYMPQGWFNHLSKPQPELLADFTPQEMDLMPRLRFSFDANPRHHSIKTWVRWWIRSLNEASVYQNLEIKTKSGHVLHIIELSWRPPQIRQVMRIMRASMLTQNGGIVSMTYEDANHNMAASRRAAFFKSARTLRPIPYKRKSS